MTVLCQVEICIFDSGTARNIIGWNWGMIEQAIDQPKEQNLVLGKAMNLFWERGAEVASYSDLVKATGVSRKALYAQWPDKDALIADTLEIYSLQLKAFLADLLKAGGKRGLVEFWDGFEAAAQQATWAGCYLFRTSVGPLRQSTYVQELYQNYCDYFVSLIAEQINQAQTEGKIDAKIDANDAAMICFSLAGTISTFGGQSGYDTNVARLFNLARLSCGLEVCGQI